MRTLLLISLIAVSFDAAAQTPAPPAPAPPAAPAARPPVRRAAPASRTALTITVTDPKGATLPGVTVQVTGPADRDGVTDESGRLRFTNLRAGTYRARFSGDGVITFEREISIRAGQAADVDVTLNAAPAAAETATPAAAEAPPTPAAAPVGPAGQPTVVDIPDFAERNLIRREPRRESPLACSGNLRTTLVQLNEPQPERLYENAESMYYVVAGEGTLRLNGRDMSLRPGMFALVPRGTAFAISRRGRNPIVLLAVLSGEPCETAQ